MEAGETDYNVPTKEGMKPGNHDYERKYREPPLVPQDSNFTKRFVGLCTLSGGVSPFRACRGNMKKLPASPRAVLAEVTVLLFAPDKRRH